MSLSPQAINDARRLVRHHAEHVSQHIHALLWDITPMVDDLRSFVSKTALMFMLVGVLASPADWFYMSSAVQELHLACLHSQDCSRSLGSQLDGELEYLVPMLLKKAGAASSGRDSFLAHHADLCVSAVHTVCALPITVHFWRADRCNQSPQCAEYVAESLLAAEVCWRPAVSKHHAQGTKGQMQNCSALGRQPPERPSSETCWWVVPCD